MKTCVRYEHLHLEKHDPEGPAVHQDVVSTAALITHLRGNICGGPALGLPGEA